jgi:hypothetical protein
MLLGLAWPSLKLRINAKFHGTSPVSRGALTSYPGSKPSTGIVSVIKARKSSG